MVWVPCILAKEGLVEVVCVWDACYAVNNALGWHREMSALSVGVGEVKQAAVACWSHACWQSGEFAH